MAYSTINKPGDYFQTKLYTGDDTNDREISLDFSPDWTWIKARNVAYGHTLYDRVRGIGKGVSSHTNAAEATNANGWTNSGCTTDSFTVDRGTNESLNETARPFVSWHWLAGGSASSNTDGDITSSVSANTTSGFSVLTYTGTGTAGDTVGHGLGATPNLIIVKRRDTTGNWGVYHSARGAEKYLELDGTAAEGDSTTPWNDTEPTSSVFSLGTWTNVNASSGTYVAYCFAEKKGFSKFGSYTGNSSTDGTFVYTGFKPAFLIQKRTDSTSHWRVFDSKREGYNVDNDAVAANGTDAEGTGDFVDLLSNGFKFRSTDAAVNGSSGSYIYIAFAERSLVGTNDVPALAR